MIGSASNLAKKEDGYLCGVIPFQVAPRSLKVEVRHCLTCRRWGDWQMHDGLDTMLSAPAFDDNDGFVLSAKIFVDKKPEFYEFSNNIKKSTEADVLARFSEKRG